jgi:hypothetical protein
MATLRVSTASSRTLTGRPRWHRKPSFLDEAPPQLSSAVASEALPPHPGPFFGPTQRRRRRICVSTRHTRLEDHHRVLTIVSSFHCLFVSNRPGPRASARRDGWQPEKNMATQRDLHPEPPKSQGEHRFSPSTPMPARNVADAQDMCSRDVFSGGLQQFVLCHQIYKSLGYQDPAGLYSAPCRFLFDSRVTPLHVCHRVSRSTCLAALILRLAIPSPPFHLPHELPPVSKFDSFIFGTRPAG